MGKTAAGAVWLDAEQLSVYDFWQYWRNTEDDDVGRFMRLFTELPLAEITKLESLKDENINKAKIILADQITNLCHAKSDPENPRWYMVDVEFVSKVDDVEQPLSLHQIKADDKLLDMELIRYGRLSVQSVKKSEFDYVKKLAGL